MTFHPERLREAREKKGLTQRELAQRCGFNEFQVSRYETGKTEPSLSNLAQIAHHLAVSTDYLLGLTNSTQMLIDTSDPDDSEHALLDTFRREGWPGVFRLGADKIGK